MPVIKSPQLYDPEFLFRTLRIPAGRLARQRGCDPLTVERCRRMHGLLERPRWSEVEIELLIHFYGRFPAAYISEGLRRSQRAIHTYAHRHGLKGDSALRASEEARARFWAVWQHYIRDSPYRWVQEDLIHRVLDLLWRPVDGVPSCRDCYRLLECWARSAGPLPCERLTVREALEHL